MFLSRIGDGQLTQPHVKQVTLIHCSAGRLALRLAAVTDLTLKDCELTNLSVTAPQLKVGCDIMGDCLF